MINIIRLKCQKNTCITHPDKDARHSLADDDPDSSSLSFGLLPQDMRGGDMSVGLPATHTTFSARTWSWSVNNYLDDLTIEVVSVANNPQKQDATYR